MPYYFMRCMAIKGPIRRLAGGSPVEGLKAGAFSKGMRVDTEVKEPVNFRLRETSEGDMPEFFMTPAFVVQTAFAEALRNFGIDNIDFYKALVHDAKTQENWEYELANIIGVIDVIDEEKSKISPESPPIIAKLYDHIEIDEFKAKGNHIFRPLHKSSSILVSQEMRNHIESQAVFKHVEFIDPADYA